MATTIIKRFKVNDKHYCHEMDLSDDSISLLGYGGYLLRYDCHAKARKPDGTLYGVFKIQGDKWVFIRDDSPDVIFGNKTREPDGLIDFEVEISKMYIKELENERTI